MTKIAILFSLVFFLSTSELSSQEVGSVAASAAEAGTSNNWKNWVFAGSALITVTVGVVIVSLSTGTQSH